MRRKIVGILICMLLFAAVFPVAVTMENSRFEVDRNKVKYSSSLDETIKWEQMPDVTNNGIDICVVHDSQFPRILADDFECTTTGPITDIHFWGSWNRDEKGEIYKIHLSIHEDIPAGPVYPYSMPGEELWSMDFVEGEFEESMYEDVPGEWWWDPYTGELTPDADFVIWQYDILIDEAIAFIQEGTPTDPKIYWLDIYVEMLPGTNGEFGWKTSMDHWNDDAVLYLPDNPFWFELRYPDGHPYYPESIDLAFRITTKPLIPDLECEGSLSWTDVDPGGTVYETIYVSNVGDPGSELDWLVCSTPSWGTWTFVPTSGLDLKPSDGAVAINVTVVAPNQQNQQFTGDVKLCNDEDSTDICTISVSLKTPLSQQSSNSQYSYILQRLFQQFPILEQIFSSNPFYTRISNIQ